MSVPAPTQLLATYRVGDRQSGMRLDLFLKSRIPKMSRAGIQQAIRSRVVLLGRATAKPSRLLQSGDIVEVRAPESHEPPLRAELVPRLLHEDDWLVAVDKPAGLPVHATRRVVRNQLVRWLRDRYGERLALAHRIDRETSGIVLCTLGPEPARALGRDFAEGRVHKEYLAVVFGIPPRHFTVDLAVGPDPRSAVHIKQAAGVPGGAPARTHFTLERAAANGRLALVRAVPETGRRHQIRVHLAAAGFPVIGDKLYARGERYFLDFITRGTTARLLQALGAPRHLLHAAVLEIRHPGHGRTLRLEAAPPGDFEAALSGAGTPGAVTPA